MFCLIDSQEVLNSSIEVDKVPSERRRTQAENRATKRFIAMMMEKYPTMGRIAYPAWGEDKAIYVKMLIVPKYEKEIFAFSAALTGLIADQDGVQVLLMQEDPVESARVESDEQLKAMQVTIANRIEILKKLRGCLDAEAKWQKEEYLSRLKSHYQALEQYLEILPTPQD
jgi:hypothetical protein